MLLLSIKYVMLCYVISLDHSFLLDPGRLRSSLPKQAKLTTLPKGGRTFSQSTDAPSALRYFFILLPGSNPAASRLAALAPSAVTSQSPSSGRGAGNRNRSCSSRRTERIVGLRRSASELAMRRSGFEPTDAY